MAVSMRERVRLPRLLDGGMLERCRLPATALSIDLQLRATSTAEMTLSETDAEQVSMHDFMELYTAKGSAGIFWVTHLGDTVDEYRALTLRHAIDTLSANLWTAQLDYEGTVPDFLAQLLAQQKTVYWQLGTCADTSEWKKGGINYDPLNSLLDELRTAREDYYFAYDFSTTPWTLNFLHLPEAVGAEFRAGRNIEGCTVDEDDAEQCTRLYMMVHTSETEDGVTTDAPELKVVENAAAMAQYGIIEKAADVDTVDIADPDAWAADYMARHGAPTIKISMEAYELFRQTGEAWDELSLGKQARAILPKHGAVVERVVGVSYPEVLQRPERVTVSLANRQDKLSTSLASVKKEARRAGSSAKAAGRGGAKAEELKHWSQVVSYHTEALDGSGITQLYETGIELDANTGATIYSLAQGFVSQYAELRVHATEIASRVTNETFSSYVTQTASEISTKVSKDGVVSAINQTAESIKISAGKIDLDGYVTASDLAATNAQITDMLGGDATFTTLRARSTYLGSSSGGNVHIYGQTVRVYSVVDTSGNTHHVFGYT